MSVDYYMAVDPGQATGIAIGRITEHEALDVIYKAIVPFGTQGFIDWLEQTNEGRAITEMDCMKHFPDEYANIDYHLDIVCERFYLRNNKFNPDLEPLRIEGVLIDRFGSVVHWQNPSDKAMVGDDFLKEHDLWVTGSDVDHTDGRDANDAMLHLFARTMRMKHYPTLKQYWGKMPYYIAKDRPGCEGWAVVKGSGEIIECQDSKSMAIKQMVAMSIAEGIEPGGEWDDKRD